MTIKKRKKETVKFSFGKERAQWSPFSIGRFGEHVQQHQKNEQERYKLSPFFCERMRRGKERVGKGREGKKRTE